MDFLLSLLFGFLEHFDLDCSHAFSSLGGLGDLLILLWQNCPLILIYIIVLWADVQINLMLLNTHL